MKTIREITLKLSGFTTHHFRHEPTGSTGKLIGKTVTGIETPPEHRGKGGAHEVMKQITKHLDDRHMEGWLYAVPYGDHMDRKRLVNFYRKHGFKGRANSDSMVRKPKNG